MYVCAEVNFIKMELIKIRNSYEKMEDELHQNVLYIK